MQKNTPLLTRLDLGEIKLATQVYSGDKYPILFIHGSWDDHQAWDYTLSELSQINRNMKIAYDRRGHSASTDTLGQGLISEDIADAVAVLNSLNIEKAHVVGHSYGANIALGLAQHHPDLIASLFLYEPPIFGLLNSTPAHIEIRNQAGSIMRNAVQLLESGELERGTILFVEQVAFGHGSWQGIFDERSRACMLANADTWLDQSRDPERLEVGIDHLGDASFNVTICYGNQTLPSFRGVVDVILGKLPTIRSVEIDGAGHGAPISHPHQLAKAIQAHISD